MTTITLDVPEELAVKLQKIESATFIRLLSSTIHYYDQLRRSNQFATLFEVEQQTLNYLSTLTKQYQARLQLEGRLQYSPAQVLQELGIIRDKIAAEDYPQLAEG